MSVVGVLPTAAGGLREEATFDVEALALAAMLRLVLYDRRRDILSLTVLHVSWSNLGPTSASRSVCGAI